MAVGVRGNELQSRAHPLLELCSEPCVVAVSPGCGSRDAPDIGVTSQAVAIDLGVGSSEVITVVEIGLQQLMRGVVSDIGQLQRHLSGQLLLDGEFPFLNHRISEIRAPLPEREGRQGKAFKTICWLPVETAPVQLPLAK